ncbi:MAG: ArsC/Spx/MgsR family protein [Longimicrobiales bacterium]|nr:ArsC/Spx/MgsR family protein [Longimicrobiales bacterium]
MHVQIFGTKSCPDTRKAERFFRERRVRIHFVDLKQKAATKGELRRFAQKFGVDALLDRDSKRYRARGLHAGSYTEAQLLDYLEEEPMMLVTPLIRNGNRLTLGHDEAEWRRWVEGE